MSSRILMSDIDVPSYGWGAKCIYYTHLGRSRGEFQVTREGVIFTNYTDPSKNISIFWNDLYDCSSIVRKGKFFNNAHGFGLETKKGERVEVFLPIMFLHPLVFVLPLDVVHKIRVSKTHTLSSYPSSVTR